jgi:hypothetical protein
MAAWLPRDDAMEGAMKRVGIILLVICAVLAIGSAAGGLARAASKAAYERFNTLVPVETPSPSFFVYLPLITRDLGTWVTIVQEGFEAPLSSGWDVWGLPDEGGSSYYWARSDCRSYAGDYSAWAVGDVTEGTPLDCSGPHPDDYPNNVDSWMAYGPFSLADAIAANLRFRLWLNLAADPQDGLNICVSSNGMTYDCWTLTYEPDPWGQVTFPLDNSAVVDMRGQDNVWIALWFYSDGNVNAPEGAYVDDVLIRRCEAGTCPTSASAGAQPSAAQWRKVQPVRVHEEQRLPAEQQPPR